MSVPKRIKDYKGRYAMVDGITFRLPVNAQKSPAIMAGFLCDFDKARELLPGNELYPVKAFGGKAVFIVTVIDYRHTTIGKYIEYSIALAVTRGRKQAPAFLPAVMMKAYKTGQYILDLPVSSEISVKGGKGIWGMPKHKANLDFIITDKQVSAQYEKDGQFAFRVEIDKPSKTNFPVNISATNYSHFRNMLMASYIHFKSKAGIRFGKNATGRLFIGDHPRVKHLRGLHIQSKPFFTMYMPEADGILDDYFECWFITYNEPPSKVTPEGFESVINLGLNEEWLPAPSFTGYEKFKI